MTCEEAQRLVHLNRPGERTESEEQMLGIHLRSCTTCSAALERVRSTAAGMDDLARMPLPRVHIAAETVAIMQALRGSEDDGGGFMAAVLRLAERRSIRIAYGVMSAAALLSLTMQLSSTRPAAHDDGAAASGAYVSYTVDTRAIMDQQDLPIPEGVRETLLDRSPVRMRKDEVQRVILLAGQTTLNAMRLSAEQRRHIDDIIASLQQHTAITIHLGKNGG